MSRRGNSHDNVVTESFFNLLKRERLQRRTYKPRTEARRYVFGDIVWQALNAIHFGIF